MGSTSTASWIIVTAALGALFGRKRSGDDHGEVPLDPGSLPESGSTEPTWDADDRAVGEPESVEDDPVAPMVVMTDTERPGHGGGVLKPVPHPIRPWELWHPASEPPRLHRLEPEEQVSWRDIADEDDPVGVDDIGEEPRSIDGDVLFRDLVDPERIIAHDHAPDNEAEASGGSVGGLINGPVRRRTDGDPDRTRRRLAVGLRLVKGGDQAADP